MFFHLLHISLHTTAAQYLKDNKEALKNLSVPLEIIQFDDAPDGVHVPAGHIYATYVHEGNYSITYLKHSLHLKFTDNYQCI